MSNVVVLLAGGSGLRMHSDIPKQHIVMNEHQIIEYTLLAFSKCEDVDAILVVGNNQYQDKLEAHKLFFPKLKWVIGGGDTRIMSAFNAISFLQDKLFDTDNIIISDGARPCITKTEIKGLVSALDSYKGATTALTSYETLVRYESGEVREIIPREGIARQTSPEGFKYGMLKQLYLYTDIDIVKEYKNIGVDQLLQQGEKVAVIDSNVFNFKITTTEDLYMFDYILKKGFEKIIEQ